MFNVHKSFIKNTFKIKLTKLSAVCRERHVKDKSGRLLRPRYPACKLRTKIMSK